MRRLALLLLAAALLTCTSARTSLPRGVVYLSEDGEREIRAHSATELDYREGDDRYLGHYTLDGDRLRVVVLAGGSERIYYFTLGEQGLLTEDESTLVAVEPGESFDVVDHRRAQRATMEAMRSIGTALFAWYTDQVGAASAGATVAAADYPPIDFAELEALLVPTYLRYLPSEDGWGHPFEFRLVTDELLAEQVILLRSPGADGRFDGDEYEIGPFDPRLIDHDIVWGDGYFMSWPERRPASGD